MLTLLTVLCLDIKKKIFILRKCILKSLKNHDACNLFSNGSTMYLIFAQYTNTVCLHILTGAGEERGEEKKGEQRKNDQ